MAKTTHDRLYVPGMYKVINPDNILKYYQDLNFEMKRDELSILTKGYEMNEYGYIFSDSNWVKISVHNDVWINNSILVDKYFVNWYVERTYPYNDGLCVLIECLFTKYNIPSKYNNQLHNRNRNRYKNYKLNNENVIA